MGVYRNSPVNKGVLYGIGVVVTLLNVVLVVDFFLH